MCKYVYVCIHNMCASMFMHACIICGQVCLCMHNCIYCLTQIKEAVQHVRRAKWSLPAFVQNVLSASMPTKMGNQNAQPVNKVNIKETTNLESANLVHQDVQIMKPGNQSALNV